MVDSKETTGNLFFNACITSGDIFNHSFKIDILLNTLNYIMHPYLQKIKREKYIYHSISKTISRRAKNIDIFIIVSLFILILS